MTGAVLALAIDCCTQELLGWHLSPSGRRQKSNGRHLRRQPRWRARLCGRCKRTQSSLRSHGVHFRKDARSVASELHTR